MRANRDLAVLKNLFMEWKLYAGENPVTVVKDEEPEQRLRVLEFEEDRLLAVCPEPSRTLVLVSHCGVRLKSEGLTL